MKNENAPHVQGQTPKDLLAHLNTLVVEAERMMSDSLTENTEDAMDSLRARIDVAQQHIVGLYAGARKKLVSSAKHTDETIRANPYQSVAIAAGVGILFGMLLSRRNK